METDMAQFTRKQINWNNLFFYQKAVVLDQLTFRFCARFLPKFGDRTVDQMVQAARSGKQNIVEGLADDVTSSELAIKLLNVARASLKELLEDYLDYLRRRQLPLWDSSHPRYDALLGFCRKSNALEHYASMIEKGSDEELANLAITLCHMTDCLMVKFIAGKERDFIENGGIKERMTAARLGRRESQNHEIARLKAENALLRQRVAALKAAAKAASEC